ncbi:tagaturonate epimerase family protein [Alloacidobacterium sp.]|uniref:tagaturonate epimerase family protein n=1 Tax=Alloacidobacterium sp. TaxID=2951999 RepID=UPI002D673A8F|nr:tagaturonate epimerase family protein [Alloacidobacterium sp.]HYK36224.1 tagaturonate epimerase family protein [Alloacidobacterium sp.]
MGRSVALPKYSLGVGDRFAHQAKAQLMACVQAAEAGIEVVPVWNKSNREHTIIGSEPSSTRAAADAAVKDLHWTKPYFCDADHIGLTTVDRYLPACDFYTIDVADFIGKAADPSSVDAFVKSHPELLGGIKIDGIDQPLTIQPELLQQTARKFLTAIQQAAAIYRKIESSKVQGTFITEVSMDETDSPQTPAEILIILAAAADEHIPLQTIAPKFSGRFNKGVDYAGDATQFEKEFALDVAAIAHAVKHYDLPQNLKLSVHSGSDKFSIYAPLHRTMLKFDAGVHLKTAGTTWLEELIGLAEAGGEGLALAKEIYAQAYDHREELCAPYAAVIDIDPAKLPSPQEVSGWTSQQYTSALRHNPASPDYNSSLRQLLHVGFKIAAKMGSRYLDLLQANEAVVARNVTENLYQRHIAPVFLGKPLHV